jgi:hypothetical protein
MVLSATGRCGSVFSELFEVISGGANMVLMNEVYDPQLIQDGAL